MNTPSPPPAPDPVVTAQAQGTMNKETALAQSRLNMVDQYGPYGSAVFNEIPGSAQDGIPRFQQNVTLSPEQQLVYDRTNQITGDALGLGTDAIGKVASAINKPFSLDGLPPQATGVDRAPINFNANQNGYVPGQTYQRSVGADDFSADRQRVEEALFSRLNPQFERDRSSLETQLANQGIGRDSEAFNREIERFQRGVNDARNQVLLAGGNEQSRLFGLDLAQGQFANDAMGRQFATDIASRDFSNSANLTNAQFGNAAQAQDFAQGQVNANMQNSARQRGIEEAGYMRSQPINELAALMGFSPGVQAPQFSNTPQAGIAPPDYQGAVANNYNAQMNNYNQQMASRNSMLGSIFGLGGSALGGIAGGSGFQKFLFG